MTPRFLAALAHTLTFEGGASDAPADQGGRTIFGISERAHPDLWRNGPPSLEAARAVYWRDYWLPVCGDDFASAPVGCKVFDIAVNMGVARAGRLLQRAAVTCGAVLEVDGVVGPATLEAANRTAPGALLGRLCAEQIARYRAIVAGDPSQRVFLPGWERRGRSILAAA